MSSSRQLNKGNTAPWTQDGAPKGMVKNAPHDDIPAGAVAGITNAHCYPTEWQPRLASYLYSDIQPPVLVDSNGDPRDEISASKTANIITAESAIFDEDEDVLNYFVWPGEPNFHDQILEVLSTTQVRVRDSGDRELTGGCWLHAKLNLNDYIQSANKKFFLWGQDFYVADSLAIESWTKALCVSFDQPANAFADWSPMDDSVVFANSGGMFQVDFDQDPAIMFRKNTNVPSVLVNSIERTAELKYRYDYVYGMSRLDGEGLRERTSWGAKIIQESGTTALNVNTNPKRDYGIRWIDKKIDVGQKINGRLQCGIMAAAQQSPDYYLGIAAPGVSFRLTINDRTENFLIDTTPTGYKVASMAEVASAFESTIQLVFPFATCDYHEDGYFIFTSGEQDQSTMGFGTAGTGGTNIATLALMTAAAATSLNNANVWADVHTVDTLVVPKTATEPDIPEWHWTHYSVYRTEDIGPDGVTPRVDENSGENLAPIKFTWVGDVRISGAFYAYKDANGIITALHGTFEAADKLTPFEWEDGEIDTLTEIISTTQARATSILNLDYYDGAKPPQAAAIGGGRVIRASQVGNIVTIETEYNDDVFSREDERKTIVWSVEVYSVIVEYLSPTTVRVNDSRDKLTQGITLDALERNFTDGVSDAKLRDRQGELRTGLLNHRFHEKMQDANILEIVPGAMLTSARNSSEIDYCQLPTGKKYLSGYHLTTRQKLDRVEDSIQTIKKAPGKFLVICAGGLWGGPTNNQRVVKLPEFGESYLVLYVDVIDERLGIVDIGSIREVDLGVFEARCTDNSWRQFTSQGFVGALGDMSVDPETGQDRVKTDLKALQQIGASAYLDNLGHVYWGRRKT